MLLYYNNVTAESKPRQAFISYSHQQSEWRDKLVSSLRPLEESRHITAWHDRKLLPGENWDRVIKKELERSDLILLLVSKAFLNSKYCNDVEVQKAVDRANLGEAILIPVIIEQCEWHSAPFARFQSLPPDKNSLSDNTDTSAVLDECRDQISAACIGQWLPRNKDAKPLEGYGIWHIEFESSEEGNSIVSSIILKLRELTGEYDINYLGLAPSGKTNPANKNNYILLLEGSPLAFTKLENLYREKMLSAKLGVETTDFDAKLGASYYAGFADVKKFYGNKKECVGIIKPSEPYFPLRMLGIAVRPSDPRWFMAIPHLGDSKLSGEELKKAQQKIIGYFYTALGVPGEDMHVNLSPFKENRILPASLLNAPLGQVLVEQDCLLKHFTASLLHPDTDTGSAFWSEIHKTIGDKHLSNLSSQELYQRAWIVPGNAVIHKKVSGRQFPIQLPPGFELMPEDIGALITECRMKVQAETDYITIQNIHSNQSRNREELNNAFLNIFKDIVLPAIENEVNTGSHFAPLRQVYYSVILAKWYRKNLAQPGIHTSLLELSKRIYIEVLKGNEANTASSHIGITKDSPEWLIKCYSRYKQLFDDGVFKCIKGIAGDTADKPVMRVYFSGEIDFGTK